MANLNGKRVLVTGGAGFIGSHLCSRLVGDGHEVIALDNFVTGHPRNVSDMGGDGRFTLVEHDLITGLPDLPRLDQIYHLASPASPPAYQEFAVETLRVNSEGTRILLERAERDGSRFLFASTSEIYGDPLEHPQREEYRGNVSTIGPRAMYDESKRFGEAVTTTFREMRGVDTRIVRIFNTYGPNMDLDDGRVVSNFIVQALRDQPLTVFGDGRQTRSFQYVDDLVEGMVRLMASDYTGPVNIGNPVERTILDFARFIIDTIGSSSEIEHRPLPGDDPKQRRPDITLAKQVLDWEPRYSLEEGLSLTIPYFAERLGVVTNV